MIYRLHRRVCFLTAAAIVWLISPAAASASNHSNPGAGGESDTVPNPGAGGESQVSIRNPLRSETETIMGLIKLIIDNIILPIGSVLVVVMIIFTGFKFVVARGNEEKIREAKSALTWTIVGAAVLLGSWVIAQAISATLCEIAPDHCPNLNQL